MISRLNRTLHEIFSLAVDLTKLCKQCLPTCSLL